MKKNIAIAVLVVVVGLMGFNLVTLNHRFNLLKDYTYHISDTQMEILFRLNDSE